CYGVVLPLLPFPGMSGISAPGLLDDPLEVWRLSHCPTHCRSIRTFQYLIEFCESQAADHDLLPAARVDNRPVELDLYLGQPARILFLFRARPSLLLIARHCSTTPRISLPTRELQG